MRAIEGKSPWLAEQGGVDVAVKALTNIMVLRCFASKNQRQTIRGYLAVINYSHEMFAGFHGESPRPRRAREDERTHL